MEKKSKEEYTNDKTLSEILGIPKDEYDDELELTNTKLKIDDLDYIKQATKKDEEEKEEIEVEVKEKKFSPIKFLIISIIVITVATIIYMHIK